MDLTISHLQRCDIVPTCKMDDPTEPLCTTAASSDPQVDPGEPLLPDATLVLKVDMRKEAHQSLGGSHGRYTLPCKKGDRLPNSVSLVNILIIKYCVVRSGQLSPVSVWLPSQSSRQSRSSSLCSSA